MKRLAFVLAAALFALTACTSAAETATAETFPVTEATAEPTSKPAAAETGPLYTYSHRYAQDVVYDVMPAFNDQLDHIGTNVYKNDLNAGQVSLFYSCDDCCIADPYVTIKYIGVLLYVPLCVGFDKFTFSDSGDSAKKNMTVFLKHGI